MSGPYVRGRLALADIDSTAHVAVWLDAIYAAYADAPHDVLQKLSKQLAIKEAMVDPEGARETWGRRPEHVALAGKLGKGPGLEAGTVAKLPAQLQSSTPGFAPVPTRVPRG